MTNNQYSTSKSNILNLFINRWKQSIDIKIKSGIGWTREQPGGRKKWEEKVIELEVKKIMRVSGGTESEDVTPSQPKQWRKTVHVFFCPVDLYIAFLPLYLLFFCWVHAGCLGVDWWPMRNRRVGLGKVEAFTGLKLYCIYRYIFDLVIFVIGYWAWYLYIYIELIYSSWLVNLNLVNFSFLFQMRTGLDTSIPIRLIPHPDENFLSSCYLAKFHLSFSFFK